MKLKRVIDFVEDYSRPGFNAMWSFVVNALRPFSAGMGLRVASLSPHLVDIVIPNWLRNQDAGHLHEATYLTAIKEGQRLWLHRLLGEQTQFLLLSFQFNFLSTTTKSARARFSMEPQDLEIFLAEARQKSEIESVFQWQIFDENEIKCADVEIKIKLNLPKQIKHSPKNSGRDGGSNGNH
jgi:hypothetical protein